MMVVAWWFDFLSALQFLTRLPVPTRPYQADSLARAVKFFPLVGLLLGAVAGGLYLLLDPHLPRLAAATLVVAFLVVVTGGLHEDGLADVGDGFGGGWDREQVLRILRDSRIGSYGGTALGLSLLARIALLAAVPRQGVVVAMMTAHMLCRWSTLPLSYFLPPARQEDGQGARVAGLTSRSTLVGGTIFTLVAAFVLLGWRTLAPVLLALLVTLLTGLYYRRRIGGVTGDCFGATNQLCEIAVYLTAVWVA